MLTIAYLTTETTVGDEDQKAQGQWGGLFVDRKVEKCVFIIINAVFLILWSLTMNKTIYS